MAPGEKRLIAFFVEKEVIETPGFLDREIFSSAAQEGEGDG